MPAQRVRNWTITVKNWDYFDTQEWETEIQNLTEPDGRKMVRYLSIGKHLGEKTGYQHCHMNVEFEERKTMFFVKTKVFMRQDIHCEPRRGTREQCDGYLNKCGYFREIIKINGGYVIRGNIFFICRSKSYGNCGKLLLAEFI